MKATQALATGPGDVVARISGERLAVLLPEADVAQASAFGAENVTAPGPLTWLHW